MTAKDNAGVKHVVLVTGTTGFVGTQVSLAFLEAGYIVRGTARSLEKGKAWIAKFPQQAHNFEIAVVPDMTAANAYDEAIKGVDIVAHTSSPFHYEVKDNEKDMLIPAIQGTKDILAAIELEPRVKRVVVTSSFAAVCTVPLLPHRGHTYTDDSWNPVTYDEAKVSDNPGFVYCASKTLAEKEVWNYVKEKKPTWYATTLCPSLILGPPMQPVSSMDSLNESMKDVWTLINGDSKGGAPPTPFPVLCDVRDVAKAHVLAVQKEEAKNERFLTISHHFKNEQIIAIAATYPELRDNLPDVSSFKYDPGDHFGTDNTKIQTKLGMTFIPMEKTIRDTIDRLLVLKKELSAR
ncbi:hypothetical protein D9615_009806 [Tricholomella constricta]|uniref:NAD-dependent epimerase/dehydratase domain-containing protein n=1 Tax=Tricholomella constricta TaxID=117010 RepID=A0A8H5GU54_9AGAR|nr:hypothetical protein D9615_009806 [Tricholomella constricta]